MARKKRKPGRPVGSGVDLSDHLEYMADMLTRRKFRSERGAARLALAQCGKTASERHLTRIYCKHRLPLELHAMRVLAAMAVRSSFWDGNGKPCGPDGWAALLGHVEELAVTDPRIVRIAAENHPEVWTNRRHLPFPLHRLYPSEMIEVLQEAGLTIPERFRAD